MYSSYTTATTQLRHDDVIKWKHFPHYWPYVRGIHRSPVNSPHKGQWCGALMFILICAWLDAWVNNHKARYLRCHRAHYDIIVISYKLSTTAWYIATMMTPWCWKAFHTNWPFLRAIHWSPYTGPIMWTFNTLKLRQDGRHFPDDIFIYIFWMKMYKFHLRFHWGLVPRGQ